MSTAGVSSGSLERGQTQSTASCEVRPVQVEASEASYVSFDQVDDPWPGELMLVIFEDGVIFSVVVLLSAIIVHDEFALPCLVYAEGRSTQKNKIVEKHIQ